MTEEQRLAVKSALDGYCIGLDAAWEEANAAGFTEGGFEDAREELMNKAVDEIAGVFFDPDCRCHEMPQIEEKL
ncbi:hypothetical protein MPC38_06705 [Prescottella equi]|uniref:hypothetical protein n=1 Tax=Rhodococcus hoagii TaxID=43767 RepID=UPI001F5BC15D|nr:hypothetical protein [Prescottella equi]UNQ40935.1 hypothetical protein MPC38_06705 [Prescottella equi]